MYIHSKLQLPNFKNFMALAQVPPSGSGGRLGRALRASGNPDAVQKGGVTTAPKMAILRSNIYCNQWIGLRENSPENPMILMGKSMISG